MYVEKHEQTFIDGRISKGVTRFIDPFGNDIAILTSDFKLAATPDYEMNNFRRGKIDRVQIKNDLVEIGIKSSKHSEFTVKTIPLEKNAVFADGLIFYLFDHVQTLLKKRTLHARVLSSARARFFDVTAKFSKLENGVMSINIVVPNIFLRILVPRTQIYLDVNSKRILKYSGLAPIRDEKAHLQHVVIDYHYKSDLVDN
ncbi:MAG: hypothetical protein JHC93_07880 [Parachlamydiales bacterium]|nr:hypothetical protein [Parachlamydiales bacterium]